MREIVLGTAGHVDHGKTSFIRALTGIDTDRLEEEKRRGITIELGFAYLDLPCGHRLGIVDVPGHEKFVKNMVAGASGMDLLAFVIAADEGIMPQTREHFDICTLLGVDRGFVVITKKDMVDEEWLDLVVDEVREFCAGSFLEDAPVVAVSAVTGEGMEEVVGVLDELVAAHHFNEAFGPFRLPIDRVFAMKGFGAVVTGTSISGRTTVGAELGLYPGARTAKVRGIQVHSETVDVVEAGHRTAVNLQGLEKDEISRGMVLASPDSLAATYMLDAWLFYLAGADRSLKHRARVRVHLGTAELIGRVSLLDRDELAPGDAAPVQLLLEAETAVWPGDRFVIRSYSPVLTIGGGEVLGNLPPFKRKRLSDEDRGRNVEALTTLREGGPEERALLHLHEAHMSGLRAKDLAIRLGVFGKQLDKIIAGPLSDKRMVVVDSASQRYVDRAIADRVTASIVDSLHDYHRRNPLKAGLSKEQVRSGFSRPVDPKVFAYSLNTLLRKGEVVQETSLIRLAGHEVALKADEERLKADMAAWYRSRGLTAPTLKETCEHFGAYPDRLVREVLELLVSDKVLVKVSESLYFEAAALDRLARDVTAFIEREGEIDAPRFKTLSGLTRKFSIPILEYFDRVKLTIRVGDKRVLRRQR